MITNGIGTNFAAAPEDKIVKKGNGDDKLYRDDFMLMLVEQIKNQDPLEPMENTEFTAQLAQFSSLEGISNLNDSMNNLIQTQTSINNAAAINLVGKNVETEGNSIELKDQIAKITYRLDTEAKQVKVTITDEQNNVVKTLISDGKNKGVNAAYWNGKSDDGTTKADGFYKFNITAMDYFGEPVASAEISKGKVSDLIFDKDGSYLLVNNERISLDSVSGVSAD